ncbi:2-dehydro-3-deoxygalactonokinase [Pseudomonas knackmussii]|uniref:2-dehydro-3-deoxygalactonokinase n=1 Tax=Pseudomonas knackmussii TaxID=65741 RepID=A0ABY4KMU3_9PSED|nr:2-dehydro-3-deoxygalactonokinase [Pseudomonas knackmussii]UPQ82156.1 2-dehydro-3-deoxygalactonokinase [Pseudomonas knackmussii]
MKTQLIALDWGTSSLRAYRLGAAGETLEERSLPLGVMPLDGSEADFERALERACGDWQRSSPEAPIIACGMIGSAQGWRETPYAEAPLDVDGLVLLPVERSHGMPLWLVPGVIQRGALPNVMRGEETQVFGLLDGDADHAEPLLVGLPGSHSKWVMVERGQLSRFQTFMTGEVYQVLLGHTILGRTAVSGDGFNTLAFERGLQVARSGEGQLGPLSTIFSSRTLVLTGELSGEAQGDYLSGLLIGHELAAMTSRLQLPLSQSIVLVGRSTLCARYLWALECFGFESLRYAPEATAAGLWRIAVSAGLVPETIGETYVQNHPGY